MAWLDYPTCRVMTAERNSYRKPALFLARVWSLHFGSTSALVDAAKLKRAGHRFVWVEGSRATQPGVVRRRR